jgi:uncharacterized protein (DUF983 family)
MSKPDYPPKSPYATGLAGRCPRCGKGRMFKGLLQIAPACEACGLDMEFACETGDGPAVFVTLFAGFFVVGLALWMELTWQPSVWVYVLVFAPLTPLICVVALRLLKGLLIALLYVNKAEQGRLQ